MDDEGELDGAGLDRAQVLAALDRLLASSAFRRATRSRDFLAYVVTETLAGRGDRLSERTIGRRALGRGADFSGTDSASVRVQAGRVREALRAYYAGEGLEDPVRISVPAGRYVAVVTTRPAPSVAVTTVPGVAVIAWTASGGGMSAALAASLSDSFAHHLAQFPHIRVVGPTGLVGDVQATGVALGVSSVLVGNVAERVGGSKLSVRLSSTDTGEVMWSAEHVLSTKDLADFEAEDEWSREIAARLGDATGLVMKQEFARGRLHPTEDEVGARLAFFDYVDRGTVESITEATRLLDAVLTDGTRPADLLAMRAALANSAQVYGLIDREEGLELAALLAGEALSRDGNNAHAHLVLGAVAHYRGAWDLAIEHANTAVRIAPLHPSYLIGAGATMCGAGSWERGSALIREAHRLHPGLAAHTRTWLAAGHLVQGDYARALGEASRLPSDGGFVWGPLYRAMALAGLGHVEQARAEAERAALIRPDVVQDPAAFFAGRMRLTDQQLEALVALVRAAESTT